MNPRLRPLALLFFLALPALTLPAAASSKPAPPKPASQYPASDTHPDEHLTIAAEPCDDPHTCSFFRLPYLDHDLLPVRVIFTNDSDRALSLDDARIQFLSANDDKVPAATEDEINRRLFTFHSTKDIHIPLDPFPIHRTPVDKKIAQDDAEFGFASTTVNPHSTLAGYLFYDIQGLDSPALRHAQLSVRMVHTLDNKQQLRPFIIEFDHWLAAHPKDPSRQADK